MGKGDHEVVDEVSHAQSLTNYSSVFCSAKSTFPHKGRLCVTEPAGETNEAKPRMTFPLGEGGPLAVDEVS